MFWVCKQTEKTRLVKKAAQRGTRVSGIVVVAAGRVTLKADVASAGQRGPDEDHELYEDPYGAIE